MLAAQLFFFFCLNVTKTVKLESMQECYQKEKKNACSVVIYTGTDIKSTQSFWWKGVFNDLTDELVASRRWCEVCDEGEMPTVRHPTLWRRVTQIKMTAMQRGRKLKVPQCLLLFLLLSTFLPSFHPSEVVNLYRLALCASSSGSSSLVLLLLLFEQLVDLPLGHGRVLADDAVLVQAGQQQQESHCRAKVKGQGCCASTCAFFSDIDMTFRKTLRAVQQALWLSQVLSALRAEPQSPERLRTKRHFLLAGCRQPVGKRLVMKFQSKGWKRGHFKLRFIYFDGCLDIKYWVSQVYSLAPLRVGVWCLCCKHRAKFDALVVLTNRSPSLLQGRITSGNSAKNTWPLRK